MAQNAFSLLKSLLKPKVDIEASRLQETDPNVPRQQPIASPIIRSRVAEDIPLNVPTSATGQGNYYHTGGKITPGLAIITATSELKATEGELEQLSPTTEMLQHLKSKSMNLWTLAELDTFISFLFNNNAVLSVDEIRSGLSEYAKSFDLCVDYTKAAFGMTVTIAQLSLSLAAFCAGTFDERMIHVVHSYSSSKQNFLTTEEVKIMIDDMERIVAAQNRQEARQQNVTVPRPPVSKDSLYVPHNSLHNTLQLLPPIAPHSSSTSSPRLPKSMSHENALDSNKPPLWQPGRRTSISIVAQGEVVAMSIYDKLNIKLRDMSLLSDVEQNEKSTVMTSVLANVKSTESMSSHLRLSDLLRWLHSSPNADLVLLALKKYVPGLGNVSVRELLAQEEKSVIQKMMQQSSFKSGDTCYILSSKWWRIWAEYAGFYEKYGRRPSHLQEDIASLSSDSSDETSPPPPIENRDLLLDEDTVDDFFCPLRENIIEAIDYIVLSKEAWMTLESWYGGGPVIPRQVISSQSVNNMKQSFIDSVSTRAESRMFQTVHMDVYPLVLNLGLMPDMALKSRCIIGRSNTVHALKRLVRQQLDLSPQSSFVLHLVQDTVAKKSILLSDDDILETSGVAYGSLIVVEYRTELPNPLVEKQSPEKTVSHHTQSQNHGIIGLMNLGNTCYLNASLQCLSQSLSLTDYLLTGSYLQDLKQHPSETQYQIVHEYASFVKHLWSLASNVRDPVNPRELKSALSQLAPQFNGFDQHDSQEFLGAVLDGLHEDLNAVRKKQYFPNPDWNGESDEVFARIFWENHTKRNDSFIVKEFQGQLRSSVECTTCHQKSLSFDPFLFLTVPVPNLNVRLILVTVVMLNDGLPMLCKLRVNRDGTIADLISSIQALERNRFAGRKFLIADVQAYYVFQILKSTKPLSTIRDRDAIFAFEYASASIARVDSEINIKSIASGPFKGVGLRPVAACSNFIRLHLVHRRMKDDWWRKSSRKPVLYGIPLVALVPLSTHGRTTSRQLYEYVVQRLQSTFGVKMSLFANSEMPNSNSRSNPVASGKLPYPFSLKWVTRNGTECRRCTDKSCSGCPLEVSDNFVDANWDDTFAIEWTELPSNSNSNTANNSSTAPPKLTISRTAASTNRTSTSTNSNLDINSGLQIQVQNHVSTLEPGNERTAANDVPVTLRDCLLQFASTEVMEEWYCPKCKEHRTSHKSLSLYRLPNILIVHLNRFKQDVFDYYKNTKFVDFPLEQLDLAPIMAPSLDAKPPQYELFGVVNHFGDIEGGHYVSYVRHSSPQKNGKKWVNLDDEVAQELNENDVVSPEAYILFYRKRSDTNSL